MLLKMECRVCKRTISENVVKFIETMIMCAEKGYIFTGFSCENCLTESSREFNGVEKRCEDEL